VTTGNILRNGQPPAKSVEGVSPLQEETMHTLATLFAAFLMMPTKTAYERKTSDQPLTPEKLIQMGAGN
jgi:hypothetical protein